MSTEGGSEHTSPTATRRFSYFCLQRQDDLCLGISPGTGDGVPGMNVQLKSYGRNLYKGIEWKKMRWDVLPDLDIASNFTGVGGVGLIRLESALSPQLCITDTPTEHVTLEDCSVPTVSRWFVDEAAGVIRLQSNPALCLTASVCHARPDQGRSCDPARFDVITDKADPGAVIFVKPCYDQPRSRAYEISQRFWRELDCVAGCPSELNYNQRCDEVCDDPACALEKNECTSSPTKRPTMAPTAVHIPPTSSKAPTTQAPILVFEAPMTEGLAAPNYWWILLLFLMLCCLATTAFLRRSKRKRYQRAFEENTTFEDKDGTSGHSHLMGKAIVDNASDDDDDSSDEARFKTASAVALNQLRYHSRAASSSNTTPHVSGESVKRRTDTSNNDRKYQFEEVGLV